MKQSDWFVVMGIVLTLITGGFAAWVQNESRISSIENTLADLERANDILVGEVLEITKELHRLKGHHQTHIEAGHRSEKDAEE